MYLKKLEIQGFKSFANKTILEFRPGVTAVIGPNGSGKSNISDAVRWVLGEQRAKSLRGGKMEDVIFTGTQNRKPLNFAEVSLIIDNYDQKLPVNFSEVNITRRIYRSGESEYFINKSSCRLKDIVEVFMGTGIGRDGYSIIGQGKIDEILSNNSEERRNIFEEAAGISKYKVKKAESEKKLQATCENLIRINDIIAELGNQIEPLKMQSEKAVQFLNIREKLKLLEINIFLSENEKLETVKEQIDKRLSELSEELSEKNNAANENIEKKNKIKEDISLCSSEIDLTKDFIFEKQTLIEKINSEINLIAEKTSNNTSNILRCETEIQEIQKKIFVLSEEKTKKEEKIKSLSEQKKTYSSLLLEKETEYAKIMETLSSEEIKIETMKNEIFDLMEKKSDLKSEMNSLITMQETSTDRDEHLKNKLSNLFSINDKLRFQLEDDTGKLSKITSELKSFENLLKESKNKQFEIEENLKALDERILSNVSEISVKTTKRKFLIDTEKNNDGYLKSVKGILDECAQNSTFKKGLHGTLAQLISVPEKYELPMEIALGLSIQNIVTDTKEDAKKAIEFLKSTGFGRATFFPLTSFKQEDELKFENKLSECPGYLGIASKLIQYNPKYRNIICSLLGKTVIVENIDNAINMSKKVVGNYRIVSLAGDIVNTSGTMSGGSTKIRTDSLLARKRIIETLANEITLHEKTVSLAKKEKEKLLSELIPIKKEAENTSELFHEKELFLAGEKEKLSSLQKEITQNEEKIKSVKEEKERILSQNSKFNEDVSSFEAKIKEAENRISDLQTKTNEYNQKNKEQAQIRDNLSLDITDLKISASSFDESISSLNEMIEKINSDLEESTNFIEKREVMKKNLAEEIEKLKNVKTGSGDSIKNTEKEIDEKSNYLSQTEAKRIVLLKELDEIENRMNEDIRSVEETKNKISKEEMKKMKVDMDFENISNKIWEDYQVTYSSALQMKQDLGTPNKMTSLASSLRNEIKNLGSINIDSIEEYKKVNERFEFLSKQQKDLTDSEQKLRKVISDMVAVMKEEFLSNFKIINENFKNVFSELFDGGTANIKLCDEENVLESGIDIEVQPPGKKLQNMMLLSGGERAFTAIALLFAILKINPSPFCILDEIEAALDDVNVYRFADYVKKFSKKIQFVIITHRKGTMENADTVYGVTMQEKGISNLVSMQLA